ncbi:MULTISPECIES: hypothetical protein, partial [unclassified Endozoicomonas]|uniref:hypothetical protein n=1 Tax=unclassified Endozoicomonas TaxID=2644528 RepID=UPI002148C4B6
IARYSPHKTEFSSSIFCRLGYVVSQTGPLSVRLPETQAGYLLEARTKYKNIWRKSPRIALPLKQPW